MAKPCTTTQHLISRNPSFRPCTPGRTTNISPKERTRPDYLRPTQSLKKQRRQPTALIHSVKTCHQYRPSAYKLNTNQPQHSTGWVQESLAVALRTNVSSQNCRVGIKRVEMKTHARHARRYQIGPHATHHFCKQDTYRLAQHTTSYATSRISYCIR